MEKLCYLCGRWSHEGEIFDVTSPYSGDIVGRALRPGQESIEKAVSQAAEAFAVSRKMPAYEKEGLLERTALGLEAEADKFARMIARESGKPMKYARGEVSRAVMTFREAARECGGIAGEVIRLDVSPATRGKAGITGLFPLGPVLAITPFNFPLNLVAHKIAPAIAAGCPVILKPSSETPLTALMLADVIDSAGAVDGMLSVLPMTGREASGLCSDRRIRKVTFTGSAPVGWALKRQAWDKRVTLELGGNAAVILHEDWDDMPGALERIVTGAYAFSGQVCISVQRVFVHNSILEDFLKDFSGRVSSLKTGDPEDEDTEIGPMITQGEAVRVESWVEEALAGGANLVCGGRRKGAFIEPAVIRNAAAGMKVVDEEVFGPVAAVFGYDDFDEAVESVNDSKYGLQAGVYTRDFGRIRKAFEELEVGGVIAGDVPTFRVDRMPYGGVKESGTGREGLRYAIRELCETRLLVLPG